MKDIVVKNIRDGGIGDGVYIGRAGKGLDGLFGNPVKVGGKCRFCKEVHPDNGSTLPCYKRYLWDRYQSDRKFQAEVNMLRDRYMHEGTLTLVCFCKPKPCHGDVLAKLIEYLVGQVAMYGEY